VHRLRGYGVLEYDPNHFLSDQQSLESCCIGVPEMKHIELIQHFDLKNTTRSENDKQVNQLYAGAFRKIVEVRLQNGAMLARHKANVPISVYCLSGQGKFTAGKVLEDSQELRAGTLITLEADIDHEVTAEPDLHIIVTKFMDS